MPPRKRAAATAAPAANGSTGTRTSKRVKKTKEDDDIDVQDDVKVESKPKARKGAKVKDEKDDSADVKLTTRAKKGAKVKEEEDDEAEEDTSAKAKPAKKATKPKKGKKVKDEEDEGVDEKAEAQNDSEAKTNIRPEDVPIDEGCYLAGSNLVYIDDDGVIYDVAMNQTNASNNNNKFYRLQLLKDTTSPDNYTVWTRWGRVGEHGANKATSGTQAAMLKEFNSKFKAKSGLKWENRFDPPQAGKYVYLEKFYEAKEDPTDGNGDKAIPDSKLAKPVQQLMQFIFNKDYIRDAMNHLDYDVSKLPLGKLSKRTIEQAYQTLKDLNEILDSPNADKRKSEIEALSNAYLSLIPHSFGRGRPPIINNEDMLKKETDLLDSLGDMKAADDIMKQSENAIKMEKNPMDAQYDGLGMQEMEALARDSDEFKDLEAYLHGTKGHSHYMNYKVHEIFRIERNGEHDRFKKSAFGKMKKGDRRLLWHGSRSTNFGGILSTGLRIAPPEAPVSGYMFGKGIYLADMSSKSANYCVPSISGGAGLLLLCEAELGDPLFEQTSFNYEAGEHAKKQGSYSTWGKGLTAPKKWKDAGSVNASLKGVKMPDVSEAPGDTGYDQAYLQYNEFIVYDVAQIRLRYLLKVQMH